MSAKNKKRLNRIERKLDIIWTGVRWTMLHLSNTASISPSDAMKLVANWDEMFEG